MLKRFLRGAGSFLGRVASLLLLCAVRGQNSEAAPEHTNRLIAERSPYLLQHAHNPVDWYPWGEEAFAKARKENKPIFLSVGYSTCHWCHVMERESFENPAIAGLLNDHFISIKVDREERPDVDATYMAFIQATTGGGGWPMTVFLTPDLKPFTGGTYFPAVDSDGQPGLETILPGIADAWQHHAPEIAQRADELLAKLREFTSTSADEPGKDALGLPLLDAAYKQLSSHFDAENGGFGAAPKFPQPANLDLLTRVYARQGANTAEGQRALEMDLFTLRRMAAGGIHDHLGGGFHRYATDARWHVPHFEKMLYDQAQLTIAYLEAYQITGDEQYADTARDILGYVRRDLTDPLTGGFLSAEDADSQPEAASGERVEGAFYVWTPTQIDQVLGTDRAPLFDWYYGVVETGSVAVGSDPRGELNGRNVLDSGDRTMDDAAAKFQTTAERVSASLAGARALLLAARANRPRPTRDDKIITAWNGLAISAFARAYVVLGDRAYLDAARKAAGFLQTIVYDRQTGQLKRSYREGASEIAGFSDDYAFLVRGLIDLYEADFQPEHLRWAEALQATQDKLFWDEKSGGYFNTAGANPDQLLRSKTDDDGAEPSANSVAALNLLRLGQALESEADIKRAAAVLQAFGGTLQRAPLSLPEMLVALDLQIGPARQIVVAGPRDAADTVAMLDVARKLFLPRTILLLADGGSSQEFLATHVDLLKDAKPQGGRATAYVCQNFACQLPTSDLATVRKLLLSLPVLAPRATH